MNNIVRLDVSSQCYKSIDNAGRFYGKVTFIESVNKAKDIDRKLIVTKSFPKKEDAIDFFTIAIPDIVGEIIDIDTETALINLSKYIDEKFKKFIIDNKDSLKITPRIVIKEYIPGTLEIKDMEIICFDIRPKRDGE